MKTTFSKIVTAVLLSATVLSFFTFFVPTKAEPIGFGITDFAPNVTIPIGENKIIEPAVLYNTGDFDLNITSSWVANYTSLGLNVQITPDVLYLSSQTSASIYLNITGTQIGRYDGYIDFNCTAKLPENYKGSPTTPGGRVNAVIYIVEKSVAPFPLIEVVIIVVVLSVIGALVWYQFHQKKVRSNIRHAKILHSRQRTKNLFGRAK